MTDGKKFGRSLSRRCKIGATAVMPTKARVFPFHHITSRGHWQEAIFG
jgi:hypothetical protein